MSEFIVERMNNWPENEAVLHGENIVNYKDILKEIEAFKELLKENSVPPHSVVAFKGDYSTESIACFLALSLNKNIIVPLSSDSKPHHQFFQDTAEVEYEIDTREKRPYISKSGRKAGHPLYKRVPEGSPGLVLFSSGSTEKNKGIVHNLDLLLERFKKPGKPFRMLIFLQIDHIGGFNSLFYALSNGGAVVIPEGRSPEEVCKAIERHRADLLPSTPSFLNLLLLSGAHRHYDLSSLELITYGTEPMHESTLKRLQQVFPDVRLQQTYGMSEFGVMHSRSKESGSLWMKIGGEGYDIKIKDGKLFVKAASSMVGYLNAPDPFDEEGYLDTGDLVEQDGEWIRILGRDKEIINVGGLKVYPAEVENTLLEMKNIEDASVYGEPHPFVGEIVVAKVRLKEREELPKLKNRIRAFCKSRLQSYKIPQKVIISEGPIYNERFKRIRREKLAP